MFKFAESISVPESITKVFEAAEQFARCEGILPAPESSHAIRAAIDEALRCKETGEEKTIVFGLTGTGYFDMYAYEKFHDGKMDDYFPTFSHDFISGHPPQVSIFFSCAHCLIGHKESQYTVFAPGIRHPEQLIISGVISTPLSSDHSFDTFIRNSLSLLIVARRASQVSQSNPQYAI